MNAPGCFLSRQADVAIVYQLPEETSDFNADFLEIITIGTDRLIPVFNTAFAQLAQGSGAIPYIAYPPDVFFGRVMARKIVPFLDARMHPRAKG